MKIKRKHTKAESMTANLWSRFERVSRVIGEECKAQGLVPLSANDLSHAALHLGLSAMEAEIGLTTPRMTGVAKDMEARADLVRGVMAGVSKWTRHNKEFVLCVAIERGLKEMEAECGLVPEVAR